MLVLYRLLDIIQYMDVGNTASVPVVYVYFLICITINNKEIVVEMLPNINAR
jgi:hypothetical protein